MLILDDPQRVANWVSAQLGWEGPSVDAAIGYENADGDLAAGVYFEGMSANNVFAHIASTQAVMPLGLIQSVVSYAYGGLGLERLTFAVPANNNRVVAFVIGMGAVREARLARACGDCDMELYVLWRHTPFIRRLLSRAGVMNG